MNMDPSESQVTSSPLVALLARWREGDRRALDLLFQELQPWLLAEIRRDLGPGLRRGLDSMDVHQQAVHNFLAYSSVFAPVDDAALRSLLRRIARNAIISNARLAENNRTSHLETLSSAGRSMGSYEPSMASSQSPSAVASRGEEREWVKLALQFLKEDDRFLLIAREVDGQSWEQVAAHLNMPSEDAARMRVTRVLRPRVATLILQLKAGRCPVAADQ